jgi:hypothetical protein
VRFAHHDDFTLSFQSARKEGGAGASVLVTFNVTEDEVRMQVARIVGHGESATTGQIPFTPRAKKVLELSLREHSTTATDTSGLNTSCSASFAKVRASLRASSWSLLHSMTFERLHSQALRAA